MTSVLENVRKTLLEAIQTVWNMGLAFIYFERDYQILVKIIRRSIKKYFSWYFSKYIKIWISKFQDSNFICSYFGVEETYNGKKTSVFLKLKYVRGLKINFKSIISKVFLKEFYCIH